MSAHISNVLQAVKHGTLKDVKKLLRAGSCINSANPHGWTPLHFAVNLSRKDMVEYFIAHEDIRLEAETCHGETPLLLACNEQLISADIVEILVQAGADVNIAQNDLKTPLYCLCEHLYGNGYYSPNDLRKAQILIDAGALIDCEEALAGETALFAAIEAHNEPMVALLLHAGADANVHRTSDGLTPLIHAARWDNWHILSLLLLFVADINDTADDGRTALMISRNLKTVQLLLAHNADPNIIADDQPITALHMAAFRRNVPVFNLLLTLTDYRVIEECNQFNIFYMLRDSELFNYEMTLKCFRHILESEIDFTVFFPSYQHTYNYPAIAFLFIPYFLTASAEIWEEYKTSFYLMLMKGLDVNPNVNEECILVEFAHRFKTWEPRMQEILDILIDHGLNCDTFCRSHEKKEYLKELYQDNVTVIMHLIPYFLSHASSFYREYESQGKLVEELQSKRCADLFATDSLRSYCRTAIRVKLRENCPSTYTYLKRVESLSVPRALKDYIRFKFY